MPPFSPRCVTNNMPAGCITPITYYKASCNGAQIYAFPNRVNIERAEQLLWAIAKFYEHKTLCLLIFRSPMSVWPEVS